MLPAIPGRLRLSIFIPDQIELNEKSIYSRRLLNIGFHHATRLLKILSE